METIKIYEKLLDFRKPVISRKDQHILNERLIEYSNLSLEEIEELIIGYHYRFREIEEKIKRSYVYHHKTNQKFCIYNFTIQQSLRSRYYYFKAILNYLSKQKDKIKKGEQL